MMLNASMKSFRFVMGMKGQNLAGKGESRESHNATSHVREGAETERLIEKQEHLHVNGFPGHHCLDEGITCLSFGPRQHYRPDIAKSNL